MTKENIFKTFMKDKTRESSWKKVAYFIWKDPYMVAGSNNFINELLQLNHLDNVYQNKDRYPEIELSKITLEGNPDLIFLSSEPYPFKEEHVLEIAKYTKHAKIVLVDGEMFSWYGSRLLKAFVYFKKLQESI